MPTASRSKEQQQQQQHPLALPPALSPDALDALTELGAILARLGPPQSSLAGHPAGPGSGSPPAGTTGGAGAPVPSGTGGGVTGTTPLPTASTPMGPPPITPAVGGGGTGVGSGPGGIGDSGAASAGAGTPLSIKHLPEATDALKHKLQRARAQIKMLPDMSRSMEEQEGAIAELKEVIRLQQELLARLRGIGVQFGAEGGERMEM